MKMIDNKAQKAYQAITSLPSLIPLMFISTTALIVSNDLANGTVSGKYFWFYMSVVLIAVSSVIIAILKKIKAQFAVIDCFILIICTIMNFQQNRLN